ncbi:uncharacterized protein LOC134694119 [Mytilus trossulus]|uniref:uncharacterized protein LOC134694119 n=1 Tax=Mytilus trossulus TaxID=6551 RepID=UPI0030050047
MQRVNSSLVEMSKVTRRLILHIVTVIVTKNSKMVIVMFSTFTVTQLFRPARSGTTGRTRSKQQVRTWIGQFVCLSDVNATRTPSSSEKISLQSAGLGHKKIQFRLDDSEEEVFNILSTEEKGFPQLYNIGGFELLHCTSNCRELQRLNCKWDVESLREIIGSQAKIYLRPIQRNLKVIAHSVPEATSLEAECENCHNKFILSELREHVKDCNNEENDVVLLNDGKENETLENVEDGENAEEINKEVNKSESTIQETVDDIVTTCKLNNINDPIDILRICQNKIVQGRTLDIIDDADVLSGGTNYIMVDREDILKSAMTEIDEIDNLRTVSGTSLQFR